MARLNEPAMPTESIDALKRRFVRQNREIARANSSQSLRIRTLETEVSRLLAENIVLREQVINLTQDAERERSSRQLGNDVLDVKSRLEVKLADLGSLIQELGKLPQKKDDQNSRRRISGGGGERNSPDAKHWKNTMMLGEATAGQRIDLGQAGRLPIIVEDKYYPRRTVDADEILGLVPASNSADSIESPDLGPPPVAHFDEEDPIQFDPKERLEKELQEHLDEEETTALPPNLETRRKRRDSSLMKASRSDCLPASTGPLPSDVGNSVSSLKSGAKRKLSMLVDDDQTEMPTALVKDDFRFNRKKDEPMQNAPTAGDAEKTLGEKKEAKRSSPKKERTASQKSETATRRVLGPKSTNADPSSPSKSKPSVSDKIAELKKDVARQSKVRQQEREKKNAVLPSIESRGYPREDATIIADAQNEPSQLPPKTPAGLDLFSPTSTEPSARVESRDTPPPAELRLSASANESNGSFGRASRRPRGAVSYAEPNLRDKMRRPNKELADAVSGLQRASSVKADGESEEGSDAVGNTEPGKIRTVFVKKEDAPDMPGLSEDLAGSPLGPKSNGSTMDLPTTVLADRRRRASTAPKLKEAQPEDATHVDTGSVMALGSKKAHPHVRERSYQDLETAMDKLDIFEGPSSSPQLEIAPAEKPSTASRISRRHSSMTGSKKDIASSGDESTISHNQSKAAPQSRTIDARPDTSRTSDRTNQQERGIREAVNSKDDRGIVTSAHTAKDPSIIQGSRADRAAARRRSMML